MQIYAGHTSAEKHLTGIPNALANPKSANFSSPFCKKKNKNSQHRKKKKINGRVVIKKYIYIMRGGKKKKLLPTPGIEPGPPG